MKKYDGIILESDNNFKVVDKENVDFYQYLGSKYFKYFYIRNNLYIERLNNDEKKFRNVNSNKSKWIF